MSNMNDKVALVTGAMRGVGLAIAQELLDAGATVVITDLDRAGLDDAVSEPCIPLLWSRWVCG
jgi:NAD(P)-dependent dehydrogenase (short-subunit alcohol dehydrogenase family)